MEDILWWDNLREGEKYIFSFIFIDRVGSTKDSDHYSQPEVEERVSEFRRIVENKVSDFNGKCIEWHGDGTTAFFYVSKPDPILERSRTLAQKSVECSMAIFSELVLKEELKAYMAVHIGMLPFTKEMGRINSHDLNIAGHALSVCPEAGTLLHEDVYRLLNDDLKNKFKYYGTTVKDNTPLFVCPKQREIGEDKKGEFLSEEKDCFRAKEKYLDFIRARYGTLTPKGLRQERLLDISLFKIYTPLKVRRKEEISFRPVDELIQHEQDIGISSKQSGGTDLDSITQHLGSGNHPGINVPASSPPISIPDLLARSRHAVVLGPPGAGKSTLISWLALSCAEGKAGIIERLGLEERLFPLPVSIGHLFQIWKSNKKSTGMLDAVIMYFNVLGVDVSRFIKEELENGRAFILLDGMDEIPSDVDRREISGLIESFTQLYADNRIIVTSRIIGFPGISIAGGEKYIIEDLTIDQARPIIEKWMVAIEQGSRGDNDISESIGKEEARKLIETLEGTPQLSPFIANPFLLTLTVLIHQTEAQLPNYRIQLFERMVHTLVETWHQARSIGIKQPEEQKMDFRTEAIPVLAPLALHMHEKFPSGTMEEEELSEFINKKLKERGVAGPEIEKSTYEFLQRLKTGTGLLEEKGRGVWGFSHLSFEEYLCAVELVRNELYNEYLDKYFYGPRWEEVLILVASELGITHSNTKRSTDYVKKIFNGKEDHIRKDILKKHILLAGKCMANSANIDISVMDEIVSALLEFLFCDISGLRDRATKVLREMLHLQRVMDSVKECILSKNEEPTSRGFAINSIGQLGINEAWAIEAVKNDLYDENSSVRSSAIDAICQLGIKEPWAMEAVKDGLNDRTNLLRLGTMFTIGRFGIKEPWAVEAVKNSLNDKECWIRSSAIYAICQLGIKEAWTIEAIQNGLNDIDNIVKSRAIEAIGQLGVEEVWAIEAVGNGLNDKDDFVRVSSIDAISQLGIREAWAIQAVKNGLNDYDNIVRSRAIYAIGQLGIKEEWAMEAVKNGLNDYDNIVRSSAIDAIGQLGMKEDWVWNVLVGEMKVPLTRHNAYDALWALS